ncbi:YdiU family protein [Saccharibacter sp. 17.LH.SD]|uniref:protein adenylyltransferase SelO n=1 Tax=Saccharibacter sp. 17.LH.SD TaxID=2689393 RepID=UPI001369079A|nr:YdiU family protein [Saccharibacter sp. 17.LH.SD]
MLLSHHYAQDLPSNFSSPVTPKPSPNPQIIALNEPLAYELGLDPHWLRSDEGIAFLSQGKRPDHLSPVAMAYAGHQFGQFVPSLGDGRALLVGELTSKTGEMFDLHLKGTGLTPFSRGGDGKCALGPALREYLVSEAMHALGIPTSRALAVITTGETIERETPLPGAIIARVARSHIRVGTFQYFAAKGDIKSVQTLADFTIQRLFPTIQLDDPKRYHALLTEVTQRHASLVTQWLSVGFIHGVMNTDNFTLSGETLDYGPCAFLDVYDPMKTFSFIDQHKRYAYGKQPQIALWNLSRLTECLLPLLNEDEDSAIQDAHSILHKFDSSFHHEWTNLFRHKLGFEKKDEKDLQLLEHFLETIHKGKADFTQIFRTVSSENAVLHNDYRNVRECVSSNQGYIDLCQTEIMHRLENETRSPAERLRAMKATNPRIIPRNHLIEQVISAATKGDFSPFHSLHAALKHPYADGNDGFDAPPHPNEIVEHTYCGT